MIEYLMLAGVIDQPEDLEALVAFVEDILFILTDP